MEHIIKLHVAVWYFAPRFLKFYSFRALKTGRTLTAITPQRNAYFLKTALLFVAQGLLDTLISVTFFLFLVKVIRRVFANLVIFDAFNSLW